MKDYRNILPDNLGNLAFRASNGELAWPKLEALQTIDLLVAQRIAILGGEVWLPTNPGPTLPPPNLYVWDAGDKLENEMWDAYVHRVGIVAKNYISSFGWTREDAERYDLPPYFNLSVCDEMGYAGLTKALEMLKACDDDESQ